jgi:hypothetical protein
MNIQKSAAMAGYGLGAVLGLIRLSAAQTVFDFVIAIALTGAEFFAVRLVETKTAKWQADKDKWREEEELRGRQEGEVKITADELTRRQSILDETKAEMQAIDGACHHDHLMGDPKALNNIAIHAMRNGYFAGIAYNIWMLGGGKAA